MRDLIARTFYSTKHFDNLLHNIDKLDEEELIDLLSFIIEIRDNQFTEFKRIWTLPHINDSMWHQYKMLRLHDLPEQVLLEEAWLNLRDSVKKFLKTRRRLLDEHREKKAQKRLERLRRATEQHVDEDSIGCKQL